jgi:hypothetical protein
MVPMLIRPSISFANPDPIIVRVRVRMPIVSIITAPIRIDGSRTLK